MIGLYALMNVSTFQKCVSLYHMRVVHWQACLDFMKACLVRGFDTGSISKVTLLCILQYVGCWTSAHQWNQRTRSKQLQL